MCWTWRWRNNIVEKSGAWYSYSGERIGQGRENTRNFLKENKDIFAKMDGEVRKKLNIGGVAKAEVPEVPVAGPAEAERSSPRAQRIALVRITEAAAFGQPFCLSFFLTLCLFGSLPQLHDGSTCADC